MAIAVIMDFPEASLDQYDQVIEAMGLTDGVAPPNAIFHWCAKTDDGMRVVDTWESREAFDRFAEEQIGPQSQKAGINPPQTQFFEVHNTIRAAS